MEGNLIESNIVKYKNSLISIIQESQVFDKVYFLDGNFLDYTKVNLNNSNTNKATCFVCITGGGLSPLSGSSSNFQGLVSDVDVTLIIIAKNNTNNLNSLQRDSNDVFLTSLHNIVKILYNSKELKDLSTNQINFTNYNFNYNAELAKNKLNMLVVNASHRVLFLKK